MSIGFCCCVVPCSCDDLPTTLNVSLIRYGYPPGSPIDSFIGDSVLTFLTVNSGGYHYYTGTCTSYTFTDPFTHLPVTNPAVFMVAIPCGGGLSGPPFSGIWTGTCDPTVGGGFGTTVSAYLYTSSCPPWSFSFRVGNSTDGYAWEITE